MPRHQGVEYVIHWKGEWEWEVHSNYGDEAICVVRGTVTSTHEKVSDDDQRQLAAVAAHAAIDLLIEKRIVAAPPERGEI
jgi:hypothetical protein